MLLLLLLSCFGRVRLCATPWTGSPPGHSLTLVLLFLLSSYSLFILKVFFLHLTLYGNWSISSKTALHHMLMCSAVLVTQSCLTPCNPMDCSPVPGSSVHETLQAYCSCTTSVSKGSSQPRDQAQVSWASRIAGRYRLSYQGSTHMLMKSVLTLDLH